MNLMVRRVGQWDNTVSLLVYEDKYFRRVHREEYRYGGRGSPSIPSSCQVEKASYRPASIQTDTHTHTHTPLTTDICISLLSLLL